MFSRTFLFFLVVLLIVSNSFSAAGGGGNPPPPPCSGNNGQPCGNCGYYDCQNNCIGSGTCYPGTVEYGGSCGNCGTLKRTCGGTCGFSGTSSLEGSQDSVNAFENSIVGMVSAKEWKERSGASGGAVTELGGIGGFGFPSCYNCDWGAWECFNEGVCPAGSARCNNASYQTCSSGCQWQDAGTNADLDSMDFQCGDSLCDNVAGIYNATKADSETSCTDGADNDCDGTTDCADMDCKGSIAGTVAGESNASLADATVSALSGTMTQAAATTDGSGKYAMAVDCGTYNLVVSHEDYASLTKEGIVVPPQSRTVSDFISNHSLVPLGSCEADCTGAGDDTIHSSCDGIHGCSFYDSTAAQACNLARRGWFRNYNSTHEVECPFGTPQEKSHLATRVSCSAGTLVKTSTIVLYKGKPVKLVVASCG